MTETQLLNVAFQLSEWIDQPDIRDDPDLTHYDIAVRFVREMSDTVERLLDDPVFEMPAPADT